MGDLNSKIQDQIFELENMAEMKLRQHNYREMMECMDEAWSMYPEPKTNWSEAINTAEHGFKIAKDYAQDFDATKQWLDRMAEHDKVNNSRNAYTKYCIGMYKFDTGLLDEALKYFDLAVKEGLKGFERKNDWIFYKNPEKFKENLENTEVDNGFLKREM